MVKSALRTISAVVLVAISVMMVVPPSQAAGVKLAVSNDRGGHISVALGKKWAKRVVIAEFALPVAKNKKPSRFVRLGTARTDAKGMAIVCPSATIPSRSTVRIRVGTQVLGSVIAKNQFVMTRCIVQTPPVEQVSTPVASTTTTTIPSQVVASVPVLTGLTAATDTGVSSSDLVTKATTVVVTGNATVGSQIQVMVDGSAGGTCTTTSAGHFECSIASISEGVRSITAVATIGQSTSAVSTPISVTVDRTVPTATMTPARIRLGPNASTTVSISTSENVVLTSQNVSLFCSMPGGCAVSNFAGSNRTFSFTFSTINNQANGGTVALQTGSFSDTAGNVSTSLVSLAIPYDMFGPVWSMEMIGGTKLRLTFDEEVRYFTLSDLSVGVYTVSGASWSFQSYVTTYLNNLRSVSVDNTVWEVDMSTYLRNNYSNQYAPRFLLELTGQIEDEYGNVAGLGEQPWSEISVR